MRSLRRDFLRAGVLSAIAPMVPLRGLASPAAESDTPAIRYDFRWECREHARLSSRSLPRSQSLYFAMDPWSPAAANLEGVVSYFPPERVHAVRKRLEGLDRQAYFRDILDQIFQDTRSDRERVAAICEFVGEAIYYNPIQQATEPPGDARASAIHDPVELLELHDGRCGQGVEVTLALLDAAGIEGRRVTAHHHTSCEARYENEWHLADALMFGAHPPHRDGVVLSAKEMRKDPYFSDGFPLPYLYGTAEEYLTADGFRCLGYCFGEWGTMPYHSWYWGAAADYPPTQPYPLVTQRIGGRRVRLNWSPSFKRGEGEIEYRVEIYADRDCAGMLHKAVTKDAFLEWETPEMNTIYFVEITAMDEHRRFNPYTWYPAQRNNFMLVPEDQYGWYGVV